MSAPKGPFRLVTVNTAPERAQRLIGRLVEAMKDRYTIIHEANCASMLPLLNPSQSEACHVLTRSAAIEEVGPKVKEVMPDVLVSNHDC